MSQANDPRPRPSEDPTPYLSHDDALYEVVDGRVVELPSLGAYGSFVAMRLYRLIRDHPTLSRLGVATIKALFVLDAERDLRRRPGIAFVSSTRWPLDRKVPEVGDWEVVPDLAVELLTPEDRSEALVRKVREYFQYGVRQVWLIFPRQKRLEVHRTPKEVCILDADDELDGGDLLPGFRAAVGPLFRRTPG